MTWVKVCATTTLPDARSSIAAGAHALGFIFAPSARQLTEEAAAEIIEALPPKIAKVGVVVNRSPEDIARLAQNVGLTGVQLQGDEPGDQLWAYRSALAPRTIFKTLQANQLLAGGEDFLYQYLRVSEFLDAVLIDAGSGTQRGGTGVPFDWNAMLPIVSRIKETMPVIIAGGLSPENVADAIKLFQPWGVDVVSGVESSPGKKDEAKLNAFLRAIHSAEPAANTQQSASSAS